MAVAIHDGEAENGHYYALISPNLTNEWYKFNDSIVTGIHETEVLTIAKG
jgi:ubiquitin C-terminal hydrolase